MAGWLDAIVNFGKSNADWLAPVAGAAAGALSGSKSQTTTQNSAPVLPDNVKAGYDKLIADATAAYGRPFDARPTKRVETGGNAFQQLFQNPELQMIQQQADAAYQQPKMQPPVQSQPAQQEMTTPDMHEAMLRASLQPRWMGVNKGALSPEMIDYMKSMDGTTNKYSGEKVNYADWLSGQMGMQNSGAQGALIPQAHEPYRKGMELMGPSQHAATYDPTSSWIDRLLPTLALAGITGGIGLGAGAIAGPTMAGGIAPSTAATGFKGLTSLATGAR